MLKKECSPWIKFPKINKGSATFIPSNRVVFSALISSESCNNKKQFLCNFNTLAYKTRFSKSREIPIP